MINDLLHRFIQRFSVREYIVQIIIFIVFLAIVIVGQSLIPHHRRIPVDLGPWPYYINHLILGSALGLLAFFLTTGRIGPLFGAVYYTIHEVRQYIVPPGAFDWDGLLWPLIPLILLEIILQCTYHKSWYQLRRNC